MSHSKKKKKADSGEQKQVDDMDINFTDSPKNPHFLRSSSPAADLVRMAADNGGGNFNILLKSPDGSALPRVNPKQLHQVIQSEFSHADNIMSAKYTRLGFLLLSTSHPECAAEICDLSEWMGKPIMACVIFENITNKFLLFDMPVSVSLGDIAYELETSNSLRILELRRFVKFGTSPEKAPILVTSLGTVLPSSIRIWYTHQRIRQFIDKPRQCGKCFQFTHTSFKCTKSQQVCVTCGLSHEGVCSSPMKCINCDGQHRADFNQCPKRLQELAVLRFKCENFLTFSEARRKFSLTSVTHTGSYANAARPSSPVCSNLNSIIEEKLVELVQPFLLLLSQLSTQLSTQIQRLSDTFSSAETGSQAKAVQGAGPSVVGGSPDPVESAVVESPVVVEAGKNRQGRSDTGDQNVLAAHQMQSQNSIHDLLAAWDQRMLDLQRKFTANMRESFRIPLDS